MIRPKAAILDLDGVITQTATLHAQAWKSLFDDYNDQRRRNGQSTFESFSIEIDYPKYLDGMPRYDGVANFLRSRGIDLPYGDPADDPGRETVCGLGNRKNQHFHALLEREGVKVFNGNVETMRKWKDQGLRLAVISSSKNCRNILEAAGLLELFEVRVDGVISQERGIPGKPAPDIFLEAARDLGVAPQEAIVVEDALAGVKAGKKGGFGWVIGIAENGEKLRALGADEVVSDLGQLRLEDFVYPTYEDLSSALAQFKHIATQLSQRPLILCLDYDGTLTPIVEQFDQAIISEAMRQTVHELAQKAPVAIVSGRDNTFIRQHVRLDNVYYAGSHGYQISGPGNYQYEMEQAREMLPVLDRLETTLQGQLDDIEGAALERKRFALAVHYRNVAPGEREEVKQRVQQALREYPELKKGGGKMVLEIQPDLDWNKGKAVQLIIERIADREKGVCPIYIGDDLTDEHAFRALQNYNGIGILVGDHGAATHANFSLTDVKEVQTFIQQIQNHTFHD